MYAPAWGAGVCRRVLGRLGSHVERRRDPWRESPGFVNKTLNESKGRGARECIALVSRKPLKMNTSAVEKMQEITSLPAAASRLIMKRHCDIRGGNAIVRDR